MRKALFKSSRNKNARVLLFAGLVWVVALPAAQASQVIALGSNMGVAPVLTNAVAVGVIRYSLAALRADGSVAQWGNGSGDPGVSNLVSMTTGWSHGFGFRADGTLVGWGDDYAGGISGRPADLTNAVALGIGGYNSLAVRANGTVVGWGDNTYGLLNLPEELTNIVTLSVGAFGNNAFALRGDGTVLEWDRNSTNSYPEISNVVAVAAANSYRKAVLHFDGHVTAWPDDAPLNLTNIIAIAGGGSHLLALRNDGTVIAWGCDCHGSTTLPTDLTNVTAIAAGGGDGFDYSIFLIGHTNPPPVLGISQSNNSARLTVSGQPFRRYVIEESVGLNLSGNWAFKQNLTLPSAAQTTLNLPATGVTQFYRARLMP